MSQMRGKNRGSGRARLQERQIARSYAYEAVETPAEKQERENREKHDARPILRLLRGHR